MSEPVTEQSAPGLRPFRALGMDLPDSTTQSVGECPFCRHEGKFCVDPKTGKWQCFAGGCSKSGNPLTFLRQLWEASVTAPDLLEEVRADRKLLHAATLAAWGVRRSVITGKWLVPGYGTGGKLDQLYRKTKMLTKGQWRSILAPIPDVHAGGQAHALHGVPLMDKRAGRVLVCEGVWDAMALWEVMRQAKRDANGGLLPTSTEALSLLEESSVIAVPSSNVFNRFWCSLLRGKDVVLCYDADVAGLKGMERVAGILADEGASGPKSIHYHKWTELQKDGWDVRDHLSQGKTLRERLALLQSFLQEIEPIPEEWVRGRTGKAVSSGGTTLQLYPTTTWTEVVEAMAAALHSTPDLERTMAIMLAAGMSVVQQGNPLWLKIISPPSTGKTTLAEALACCEEYVYSVSKFTGLHSGWKTDKTGEEDHGMIPLIHGKLFVIKDGDTLRTEPNLQKIMGEMRDAFDTVARVHYGHGVNRVYGNIRTVFMLCGTEVLRFMDGSELGERLLDVVVMDSIEPKLEMDIAMRALRDEEEAVCVEADGTPESRDSAMMVRFKQVAGGYLKHLRMNASTLLKQVDRVSDEVAREVIDLATFVSWMRARPSKQATDRHTRELSARLSKQLFRLGKCLAVVLNKQIVDTEVMAWVRQTAMDTARGTTCEIMTRLHALGDEGTEANWMHTWVGESEVKVNTLMLFLQNLGAAERFKPEIADGPGRVRYGKPRWRMSQELRGLWDRVMGYQQGGQ